MRTILLASVLATSACGLVSFDVTQAIPEQRVPGGPLGGLLPSFLPSPVKMNIDLKAETQARGTGPATHAYLSSLVLMITPHGSMSSSFDFLDEVHIFVSSPNDMSLARVEVADVKPVPKGLTTLTFTIVPNVDLLPYINAGSEISSDAKGTQPSKDVTFD